MASRREILFCCTRSKSSKTVPQCILAPAFAFFRCILLHLTLRNMYFVRSVDHPNASVSGQRAHVVIAGFVAKPLDGVILRSSAPFLRNAKTTGLWFISQIDLKGVPCSNSRLTASRFDDSLPPRLYAALAHVHNPTLFTITCFVLNCAARYYITDGMEDTMLRICSESERVGSEDAAAAVLQQRLSRRSTPGDRSPPQHSR